MYCELESSQIEIEKIQKEEEIKDKKLRIMERDNNALFEQLEQLRIENIHQTMSREHICSEQEEIDEEKSKTRKKSTEKSINEEGNACD